VRGRPQAEIKVFRPKNEKIGMFAVQLNPPKNIAKYRYAIGCDEKGDATSMRLGIAKKWRLLCATQSLMWLELKPILLASHMLA
jgi:hypothetical protein